MPLKTRYQPLSKCENIEKFYQHLLSEDVLKLNPFIAFRVDKDASMLTNTITVTS